MSNIMRNKSDQDLQKEIGVWIKSKRLTKKMSQQELASQSSLSRRTITNVETGKGCCLISLIALLRVLDSLEHLYDLTGTQTQNAAPEKSEASPSHHQKNEPTLDRGTIWAWET